MYLSHISCFSSSRKKSHTITARDLMCEVGEQLRPFSYPSTMYDTSFYS